MSATETDTLWRIAENMRHTHRFYALKTLLRFVYPIGCLHPEALKTKNPIEAEVTPIGFFNQARTLLVQPGQQERAEVAVAAGGVDVLAQAFFNGFCFIQFILLDEREL